MRYARHFIVSLLIFVALIAAAFLFSGQPYGSLYPATQAYYYKPVTVDVCNQTITRSWDGQYESQGCATGINHDANYYYYGTVNGVYGTYVPYMR